MAEYFTKDGDNYVKVEDTLHTQADVDKIVKDRAERLARSQYGDYDDLKKKATEADSTITELNNKLKEKDTSVEALTKDLTSAKLETDKVKLITEFKLPEDLAEFVTGDTVDEMRQRAEKLSNGVKPSKVTVTKDGKPAPDANAGDSKKAARALFGKQAD